MITGVRQEAISGENAVSVESTLRAIAAGIPGVSTGRIKVAPSSTTRKILAAMSRGTVVGHLLKRTDLAKRRVSTVRKIRRANAKVVGKCKAAKERLRRLNGVAATCFSLPMSDGTLGALTLQANGNKELDYDRELAELLSKEVKANMGAGYEVISKKSTDPETAALEEKMKEEFGVRVRFGDDSNLSFAKQIYNLCTTLKQLGHKFPNEIVLCEAAEDKSYCAGFTIKEDQRGAIVCIATVDPVNNKMGFTVGHSFKDALLHELGHVNCNESNSDANSESPSIESLGEIVDSAILELASTQSQDGANRQPWKEKLQATIKVAYESEGLSNICESRTVFACLSDLPEKQYIDLWHTVAERVKFAASAMENSPQKRVIDEVSVYASFSPFELVAEVYCGRMLGKTYSNEIMEMYSKFGGVPLD